MLGAMTRKRNGGSLLLQLFVPLGLRTFALIVSAHPCAIKIKNDRETFDYKNKRNYTTFRSHLHFIFKRMINVMVSSILN